MIANTAAYDKTKDSNMRVISIALAGVSGQSPNEYSATSSVRSTMYDTRLECYYHRLSITVPPSVKRW